MRSLSLSLTHTSSLAMEGARIVSDGWSGIPCNQPLSLCSSSQLDRMVELGTSPIVNPTSRRLIHPATVGCLGNVEKLNVS
ncbi:hypothetical protein RRG08_024748 [Elysia crispata]|uniref:Uncharacterized protein n=1 Tax=Elysia crispata TaxID=231223 RepID=A0AAE0YDU0_9GAST|nr:hypothetical protein RRG08_024748 [Elysia crispata]